MSDTTTPEGRARECAFDVWMDCGGEARGEFLRAAESLITKAIREAVEQERRACADLANNACLAPPDGGTPDQAEVNMCETIAAAIRARGQPVTIGSKPKEGEHNG